VYVHALVLCSVVPVNVEFAGLFWYWLINCLNRSRVMCLGTHAPMLIPSGVEFFDFMVFTLI